MEPYKILYFCSSIDQKKVSIKYRKKSLLKSIISLKFEFYFIIKVNYYTTLLICFKVCGVEAPYFILQNLEVYTKHYLRLHHC